MKEKLPVETGRASKSARIGKEEGSKMPASAESDITRKSGKNPKMKDVGKNTSGSCSGELSTDDQPGSTNPSRIKNLTGFWATHKEEEKSYRKKRLQMDESSSSRQESEEDPPNLLLRKTTEEPGLERQKDIEVDAGYAKNIASLFQNRPRSSTEVRKPFRLDDDEDVESAADARVVEKNPAQDNVQPPSSTKLRRRIKDLAGTFVTMSHDDDSSSTQREKIDRSVGSESTPVVEAGRSKGGLEERWRQQQLQILREKEAEEEAERTAAEDGGGGVAGGGSKKTKPAWLLELEAAKQTETDGIFENEPEVRSDVVRADDEQPDVIRAQMTRSVRKLWTNIEQEKIKEQEESKIERPVSAKSKKVVDSATTVIPETKPEKLDLPAEPAKAVVADQPQISSDKDKTEKKKQKSQESRSKKSRKNKSNPEPISHEPTVESESKSTRQITAEETKSVPPSQPPQPPLNEQKADLPPAVIASDDDSEADERKMSKKSDESEGDVPRRIKEKRTFDDEDDYSWLEESGLMLYGASLVHFPKGLKPDMCIN